MKTHTTEDASVRLSPHFTLSELTQSGTALRLGIDNVPTQRDAECLRALCTAVLEPLRQRFGRLIVTSGYRCARLNEAVGGVPASQHLSGEAADLHMSSVAQARRIIAYAQEQQLPFDQMIVERVLGNGTCWLHVSHTTRRTNRRQVLEIKK